MVHLRGEGEKEYFTSFWKGNILRNTIIKNCIAKRHPWSGMVFSSVSAKLSRLFQITSKDESPFMTLTISILWMLTYAY